MTQQQMTLVMVLLLMAVLSVGASLLVENRPQIAEPHLSVGADAPTSEALPATPTMPDFALNSENVPTAIPAPPEDPFGLNELEEEETVAVPDSEDLQLE